jgi:hypothetical protein
MLISADEETTFSERQLKAGQSQAQYSLSRDAAPSCFFILFIMFFREQAAFAAAKI